MTHEEFESIAALDAIGVASLAEASSLRLHLGGCIPCRRARDDYERIASMLALALDPVEPPQELRERINIPAASARSAPWWMSAAAALFLALWGWRELGLRDARYDNFSARAEIERLTSENAQLSRQRQKLSAELASLASPGTRAIALSGQEVAPAASAKVFLEPSQRRALVFFHDLPANPSDKSYQLWIIRADRPKPMSAGVFDVTSNGSASIVVENLPVETEIKALAVTLEPKGGVPQPTNTKFYVAGGV
jgi:cell division protein FtsB